MNRLAALGLASASSSWAIRRGPAEPPEPLQTQGVEATARSRRAGSADVAEGDDELDPPLERAAEREVPHPAAVGRDPVTDGSGRTSALIAADASTACAIVSGGVSWDE